MASSLPAEILSESGLPTDEAMDAVEVAIARTLTGALRSNVCVKIDAQLEIVAYPSGNGEPIKISLDDINGKLRRHLLYQIKLELQKRRTLNEADRLKELRGYSAPGEISRIAEDGALIVSLEIADYYRRLILCGVCPARFQPLHERGTLHHRQREGVLHLKRCPGHGQQEVFQSPDSAQSHVERIATPPVAGAQSHIRNSMS